MIRNMLFGTALWLYLFASLPAIGQQQDSGATAPVNALQPLSEHQKIEQLLLYISNLQGATFIRNGDDFSPPDAAKHLRAKFKKHEKKIKTAHDFINHLASKSSATGEIYKVRMADGTTVDTSKLLNQELQRLEGHTAKKQHTE